KDQRTKDQRTTAERAYNRCQAGLRALVEQSIGHLATAWSLRRWRGLLYRARDVFRAAAALISLGRWLHRLPARTSITDTLIESGLRCPLSRWCLRATPGATLVDTPPGV